MVGKNLASHATSISVQILHSNHVGENHLISCIFGLYAHKIGIAECYELHLVHVAFQDSSILLYPPCLQDGCFLVEFYMAHLADAHYNAINQCYWLQYRHHNSPTFSTIDVHLITPSDNSANCSLYHWLITVRSWANLTHGNTCIRGPFNFTIVSGRKTHDCIGQDSWGSLKRPYRPRLTAVRAFFCFLLIFL